MRDVIAERIATASRDDRTFQTWLAAIEAATRATAEAKRAIADCETVTKEAEIEYEQAVMRAATVRVRRLADAQRERDAIIARRDAAYATARAARDAHVARGKKRAR